ncbi:RNA cytidine acetyltransferase [Heracleum sosnowskyi]|uniref:RNA cytidine acetyltransferase n=1 Tax=Heracleum sosnowskyi TaxID=360622 RepID=A0AAD8HAK1_9APIA|nr:RNA cytidine acetyltransferase [Heracleum sosnowskyi]
MRKKVDKRIIDLIDNGVKTKHRSLFVIIGDKSSHQITNLDYLMRRHLGNKSKPHILWCYKDKLDISSHRKKRDKQLKKLLARGLLDSDMATASSLFLDSGAIEHRQYKDSEKILGRTFGMLVLQDFEALTPNLLARTIETVAGGGLIVLMLRNLSSLTSLYTMVMDVHERYRTASHSVATGRFNERFLLSLASCKTCMVLDDELNILPVFSHMKSITPVPVKEDSHGLSEVDQDLKKLKDQLNDDFPVGPLLKKCCTLDQGKAVVTFLDAILDKKLRSTIALIAGRGRGKSAALGLAISGAIAAGYSNIFVTAPTPENLKTLFEFVCIGFEMLEYKEHLDYDIVQSNNPNFKKATVRINFYRQHRQTIQYIHPHEHGKLSQVELLVVDEAAAIPLPVVKSLLGPYLVFLSSTVNGYEGTGRSLSLKLLQQLEEQSRISTRNSANSLSGRLFKKIELTESIRYSSGDPIESWLHALLCLDVTSYIPGISRLPPPSECDLYYVNRDTLFSYHKDSELFLQRMMALYVASHYKNSPNDLQLMADAPAHHLFVLLGPVDESRNHLPDILCVLQVCLEQKNLSEGRQPYGDQIPWKFAEQFPDTAFPTLSGARIVRIATHPGAMKLGYGSTAVELLIRYFEGQFTTISEVNDEIASAPLHMGVIDTAEKVSLRAENIKPRTNLPPLLMHLRERRPKKLHYISVSFGRTLDLLRFWKKQKFVPFYVGHNPNSVTGEHTCMVLKPLDNDLIDSGTDEWGFFAPFYQDFRRKFILLLGSTSFRTMEYKLAMSVLDPKINLTDTKSTSAATRVSSYLFSHLLSEYSMARLDDYVNNRIDFLSISYLEPILAILYFEEKLPVTLSYTQASVLLCMGLQRQELSYVEGAMNLERHQILSLYFKTMKMFYKYLSGIATKEMDSFLPRARGITFKPHAKSLDEDLNDGAKQVMNEMRAKMDVPLSPELLQKYAIAGRESDFGSVLKKCSGKIPSSGLVSVESTRTVVEKNRKRSESQNKDKHGSRSNKKRKSFH